MKNLFLIVFISFSLTLSGQGIEFFHGSWDEAKELAKKEQKLIFVDAFAKWCGPCKRMAKNVFPNPSVGEYYNDNFINLKIDMEEGMGLSFRQQYPVTAFPTLFYMDDQGEIIKKVVGGKAAKGFIDIGKSIISAYDRSGSYAEKYEKGDRSYDLVLGYVKALNQANKSSLKIANDYLRSNPEISKNQKSEFLYEALTHADSRIFNMYVSDLGSIKNEKGSESTYAKIEASCWNTVYSAITFETDDLLMEAQEKMKSYHPKMAKEFKIKSDYEYAQATTDILKMSSSALEMAKELLRNQPEEQVALAEELMLYYSIYPQVAETAEEILSSALKKNVVPEYSLIYAKVLLANNKKKKALKEAEKAIKNADQKDHCYSELEELLKTIKAG